MDHAHDIVKRKQARFPWKYLIPFSLPCLVLVYALGQSGTASTAAGGKVFRAGASVIDVTPVTFPLLVISRRIS
jgi:di/tricarboxylate transporter